MELRAVTVGAVRGQPEVGRTGVDVDIQALRRIANLDRSVVENVEDVVEVVLEWKMGLSDSERRGWFQCSEVVVERGIAGLGMLVRVDPDACKILLGTRVLQQDALDLLTLWREVVVWTFMRCG